MTVTELIAALQAMPGDAQVIAYNKCDEGLDYVNKPILYQTPSDVDLYCKSATAEEIMGSLEKCEPGTGQYGRKKDSRFVPYTGLVVVL